MQAGGIVFFDQGVNAAQPHAAGNQGDQAGDFHQNVGLACEAGIEVSGDGHGKSAGKGPDDIAENGAVVPIGVSSSLPKTESIAILVEKNPNALAGAYELLDGADPEVSMRIKMGQSSDVVALVKADGKFYMTKKEVKVTLGGCGG